MVNSEGRQGVDKGQTGKEWIRADHFYRLSPDETVVIPEATEDLDIDNDPPIKIEIVKAIKTLKNGESLILTILM